MAADGIPEFIAEKFLRFGGCRMRGIFFQQGFQKLKIFDIGMSQTETLHPDGSDGGISRHIHDPAPASLPPVGYAVLIVRLVDQLIAELEEKFRKDDYSASKAFYREMIRRFAAIPRHHQKKIRVGIVGEIYMKYAPLGNHHLEDFLIEEGFEPVLSGVTDFGLYCLENSRVDHRYYHRHALTFPFLTLAENILVRMQETFARLIEEDGTFHSPDRFKQVIRNADGFIDQGVKMGEGWLLTAEVVSLIKEGVSNIISAQPFGCLPNHIVAKGMAKKIKDVYPQSNLVAIDYDPSASRVNQENRIRLMLANAKLSMEELEDAKDTAYDYLSAEKRYA